MIDGNLLWDETITGDMIEKEVPGCGRITTFSELPDNLFAALKKTALTYPDKTALTDDAGNICTYRRFLQRCEELAAYLYRRKGVRAGAHVGLMMHNTIEYCVAFLALSRLGAVMVSLPSKFRQAEVAALAKRADMEFLICEKIYAEWFSECCAPEHIVLAGEHEADGYAYLYADQEEKARDMLAIADAAQGKPEHPAIMMFTSGTTSQSKAVLLKNCQVMHAVEAYRRVLHITEKDVSVIATPIYHITGLVALLGLFLTAGGTLYLHRTFDAARVIRDARTYGFTFLHASPTVFHLLLQVGEYTPEIPTLTSLACGSSNMPKEKLLRLHRWLPHAKFHTIYGLTETSSPGTVFPDDAATSAFIGSSGQPVPGMYFKIVDDEGREVSDGTVGEIAVKGSNVLDGYYGFHGAELTDGWLYTGDLGYFHEKSYLYVVDRKKNMINRGGEKIWCYDIENEMESIPGIQNAAVVGIADEVYGEVAAAVVELKPGSRLTAEEIKAHLKTRIASYKIPVEIKITAEIPQTPNGKPDKAAIKKMLAKEE